MVTYFSLVSNQYHHPPTHYSVAGTVMLWSRSRFIIIRRRSFVGSFCGLGGWLELGKHFLILFNSRGAAFYFLTPQPFVGDPSSPCVCI